MFGLVANIALILAGLLGKGLNSLSYSLAGESGDPYLYTVWINTTIVVLSGLAVMFLYRHMQKNILTDQRFFNPDEQAKAKEENKKWA